MIRKFNSNLTIAFLISCATPTAFAVQTQGLASVSNPPQVCAILFKKLGVTMKYCSGVLISPSQVLSSASCESNHSIDYTPEIRCGGKQLAVSARKAHPKYEPASRRTLSLNEKNPDQTGVENDLAVYVTEQPFSTPPMTLSDGKVPLASLITNCYFSGYERQLTKLSSYASYTGTPVSVKVPQVSILSNHTKFFATRMLASHGDSGGPLYCERDNKKILIGIYHGSTAHSSFYSRVSFYDDQIQKWIDEDKTQGAITKPLAKSCRGDRATCELMNTLTSAASNPQATTLNLGAAVAISELRDK